MNLVLYQIQRLEYLKMDYNILKEEYKKTPNTFLYFTLKNIKKSIDYIEFKYKREIEMMYRLRQWS